MGYYNYMTKIALLLGADPQTVHENMNEVLDFEIKLANVSDLSGEKTFLIWM